MPFPFYGDPNVPDEGYALVPEGERVLEIIKAFETQSKGGDDQTEVTLKDIETSADMLHWVTFIKAPQRGHGLARHWLKVITGACDGDIVVNPQEWLGVRIRAVVFHAKGDKGRVFANLDINSIQPYDLGPGDFGGGDLEPAPF